MNKRAWKAGALALLMASIGALIGWAQDSQVYPQGLIIDPPQSEELEVSIMTDKAEYRVGESVTISYEVNRAAYIYIWDIMPTGEVQVVFPNPSYPGGLDNYVQAGAHQLPRSFPVAPPLGTEYLQILATTQPVDVSSFPMSDPGLFQQQVEVQILGLLLEDQRSWNFTSFEITDQAPPNYGTVNITSTPPGATITLDGTFVGYTPRTHFVTQGLHRISVSKPGYSTYNVVLIIFGTGTRTIHAELTPLFPSNSPPTAAYSYSPQNPAVNTFVQFNASASSDSDGSIASYNWNFGDGTTGSGSIVWHRFTSAGSFSVRLTVTDDDGASRSVTKTIQVGPTNLAPNATFDYSPTSPAVGAWVRFDGTSSTDSDGTIAEHRWTFDDGSSPELGNITYHRFSAAGTYLVTLTVTDDEGASDSVSQQVVVGPTQQPPVAAFTYSPTAPEVGDPVTFNASSSFDPDGTIVSYNWDLNGDGTADASGSTGQVTYSSAGTVLVTLTVTDNGGLSSSTSQEIVVSQAVGPSGAPPMGTTPGVFVWGTDRWHVTVNAGGGWTTPHRYRLKLRSDEPFQDVNEPFDGGVIPLGLIIEPEDSETTLVFEGSITSGSLDHTFRVPDSSSVWMSLELDTNGDGTLDESTSFVYLRHSLVRPPAVPTVLGLPRGYEGELLPTINFRVGTALPSRYTDSIRWIVWQTTISALEGF